MSRYWDDELYHHGIKGQSWGAQNGPPYPLNAAGKARFRDKLKARTKALKDGAVSAKKKLANISTVRKENKAAKKAAKMDEKAERRAEKRNQTLDKLSRSPTALYRNRDAYSTKELKDALDRINTEQKLHEMSIKELNRGKDVLDTIVGYGQTAVKAYSTGTQLKKDFDELFSKKTNSDSKDNSSNSEKMRSASEAAKKMYEKAKEKRESRYKPYNGEWDEKGPLHGTVEGTGTSRRTTENDRPRSWASRSYKPRGTYDSTGFYRSPFEMGGGKNGSTSLVPVKRRRRW